MTTTVRISILCVALYFIHCDSDPTQSVPQQLDPEILKTFPKWRITFHAVGKFSNGNEREEDIVEFNNYSDWSKSIWLPLKWLAATSIIDTSLESSSSGGGGSGGGSTSFKNELYSYQATITTTNTISGSCSTLYNRQETYGHTGGHHEYYSFSMKYSGIPLHSVSSDSVVFYLSGDSLRSKLSDIKREEGSMSPDYKLTDILWDKQPAPSLTIVYYK